MKIFVTGGAGFIGRHLVRSLLKSNHEVSIFENFTNSNINEIQDIVNDGTKIIKGDLNNFKLLKKSLRNIDVVIHLAAKIDILESIKHPELSHKINVIGSMNLLKACVETNVSGFIGASSAAIYGNPKKLPVKENSTPNPVSPYGAEKLAMENYITAFSNIYDLNSVSLRFFNVYGANQSNAYAGVITKFINQIRKNQPLTIFGNGENTRDYIHVDDLVDGIIKSISKIQGKKGEVYNLASGKSISVKDLAELMVSVSKKDLDLHYTDPRDGDLLHSAASIKLAKDELEFQPKISLEKGLSNLINQ